MSRAPWHTKKSERWSNPSILDSIEKLLSQDLPDDTRLFVSSLRTQYSKYGGLTPNQVKSLERIEEWLKPEAQLRRQEWHTNYDEEKRKIAKICASYYIATKYFYEASRNILANRDYIPSEKTYSSMCDNKFAKKVIEATLSEPRYPIGSLVQVRRSTSKKIETWRDCLATVLDIAHIPVSSAAKGAKPYKILPVGETRPITVEERYLKKTRKKA